MPDTVQGLAIDIENLKWPEVAALGDVVIVLRCDGTAGRAYIRGNPVPFDVRVDYGERDDPALSIRRVSITAGWSRAAWRRSPLDARRLVGVGSELWRKLASHRGKDARGEARS